MLLLLALLLGLIRHVFSTTTNLSRINRPCNELCLTWRLVYTQPFPSDKCPGCQVNVRYDYSTATNPKNSDQGVLYVVAQEYIVQAVRDKGGKCVTDFGFPVNMGGSETMTISTKVNSSKISAIAKSGISQMLGPNLCVTTPSSTIPLTGVSTVAAPSSTTFPNPFTTSAAANASIQSSEQLPSGRSQNPSNAPFSSSHSVSSSLVVQSSTTNTAQETLTVTQAKSSPTEAVPQAALSPDKKPKDNTQKLQIIAGVVTSVLGIAAIALALLLWRRYRRHRRGSASSDDTFFQPKPELESPTQVPGSVAKASVSTAPVRSTRKDPIEMAGETGSMDSRWRETYYEERKIIPQKIIPQELKGAEPPRYEMDAQRSRNCSISPLTP